jgi:hypothetical protein
MVEGAPPITCYCKIVGGRIAFCALHAQAAALVTTCEHVRRFLNDLQVVSKEDAIKIKQVILPYIDRQIAAARRGRS